VAGIGDCAGGGMERGESEGVPGNLSVGCGRREDHMFQYPILEYLKTNISLSIWMFAMCASLDVNETLC
jgi:hypothetical protein